ncbi:MAG: hypothetical protein JSV55_08310, partial [Deltaproteobacteria bacterium]
RCIAETESQVLSRWIRNMRGFRPTSYIETNVTALGQNVGGLPKLEWCNNGLFFFLPHIPACPAHESLVGGILLSNYSARTAHPKFTIAPCDFK